MQAAAWQLLLTDPALGLCRVSQLPDVDMDLALTKQSCFAKRTTIPDIIAVMVALLDATQPLTVESGCLQLDMLIMASCWSIILALQKIDLLPSRQACWILQVHRVLEHFQEGNQRVDAALILFTRLAGYDAQAQLSLRDDLRFRLRLGVMAAFRADNPTGHYELELALVCARVPFPLA